MESLQDLAAGLGIDEAYIRQGADSLRARTHLVRTLLAERRIPTQPWPETVIEDFLRQLAAMDSNNFLSNTGLGEREGRIYSRLVAQRHYGFAHGIGRSGDIAEVQPKAAGSSVLYKLVNYLALHAVHIFGLTCVKKCLVVPIATGMSLALCIQAVRKTRPGAKYVIWSRIDQKSCYKSIAAAGLAPLVVENVLSGDSIETNVDGIEALIAEHGDNIACVLTTTSCFAPRCPDRVDAVALLCERHGVPHIVNNAYGLQCNRICKLINRAVAIKGRIDFIVQSTDKNLMVPVGGAIIASPNKESIAQVSKLYAGRASSAPIVDIFITLMSMGESGLRELIDRRVSLLPKVIDRANGVAREFGERILLVPNNTISFGISLAGLGTEDAKCVTYFGSMLFHRCVSGSRVVSPLAASTVDGHLFNGWGAHLSGYPTAYLTVACTIGLSEAEVDEFCRRLRRVFVDYNKSKKHVSGEPSSNASAAAAPAAVEALQLSSNWVSKYSCATYK